MARTLNAPDRHFYGERRVRYIVLMDGPRGATRKQADAELMDWEVSLGVERFLAGDDEY